MTYDVIIIGAGPAGIFSALDLCDQDHKILLLEAGKNIEQRICPKGRCAQCPTCNIMSGWGGAGAFSDGKLSLDTNVGGWLHEYINQKELKELIIKADRLYQKFGAPKKIHGTQEKIIKEITGRALRSGLTLIQNRIRHMGSDNCYKILKNMRDHLKNKIDIRFNTRVDKILIDNNTIKGVRAGKKDLRSDYVIAAPGRVGSEWLRSEAKRLGLGLTHNPIDLGVRVETRAEIMKHLTDAVYEPKLHYYSKSFDDKVRTFCVCPNGYVSNECYENIITVNGQSYHSKKSKNTNFAILVSMNFTHPFKKPIEYGKYIARLANNLSGGKVLIQRLKDLKKGRRSTPARIAKSEVKPTLKSAVPGDISYALPYRVLQNIMEMLEAMEGIAPGINSDTLLYGVEAKFYSSKLKLTKNLESETIKNLFATGDGAGVTRGLMQASVSGMLASKEIKRRS